MVGRTRICQYCETLMPATVMLHNKNWHYCRAEIACFNRLLAKYRAMKRLKRIGMQMANACFNLSQNAVLHADDKEVLERLRRQWDEETRNA